MEERNVSHLLSPGTEVLEPVNEHSTCVEVLRSVTTVPVLAPSFFELGNQYVAADWSVGQRSWSVRGRNACVVVSWLSEGETAGPADHSDDEQLIAVPRDGRVSIQSVGGDHEAEGPVVAIAPAGTVAVTARAPGLVVRVFTAATTAAERAINASTYSSADVTATDSSRVERADQPVRVFRLDEHEPGPHGWALRTASLMLVWREVSSSLQGDGTGDRGEQGTLTLHCHPNRERMVVGLAGEQVHHVRRPWTPSMREWRPDEHVQVASPAVTIVPPGNINATRAIGVGPHAWLDVFSPPLTEFTDRGWLMNHSDYEPDAA